MPQLYLYDFGTSLQHLLFTVRKAADGAPVKEELRKEKASEQRNTRISKAILILISNNDSGMMMAGLLASSFICFWLTKIRGRLVSLATIDGINTDIVTETANFFQMQWIELEQLFGGGGHRVSR